MAHLENDHPSVLEYLESGGFAVQIGESNPFGKIPVDQACEETVNRDTKTPGGTIGFSLRPQAVSKCYLVAEYRCIFMRNLKDILQLNTLSCLHNDLQKTRIYWDESDVKSLLSTLDSWINPFVIEKHALVCLSTNRQQTSNSSHRWGGEISLECRGWMKKTPTASLHVITLVTAYWYGSDST